MDERVDREQRFHDTLFGSGRDRIENPGIYSITVGVKDRMFGYLEKRAAGKRLLELGCAQGYRSRQLALQGGRITAIDISGVVIDRAREAAAAEGLDIECRVMNAEQLDFPDDSFDIVYGMSILHHLDIERVYREIARVLKPGGFACFLEPLGHNPLINWYRRRTPDRRTADEHPLLMRDIRLARSFFGTVDISYHILSSLGAVPLWGTPAYRPVLTVATALDSTLFTMLPFLRRYGWIAVITLEEPKRGDNTSSGSGTG